MYKGYYWRRRSGYEKINGFGVGRRSKSRRVLGSEASAHKRRIWRIKIGPKLKLSFLRRIPSPKKLLLWLRDSYVKLMLVFANSRVLFNTGYGGIIGNDGVGAFVRGPLKEYDDKMIVEIYKSLMLAQDQLLFRDVPEFSSAMVSRW